MIVVLVLAVRKVNIGYSLVAGSTILALLNGKGLIYLIKTIIKTLSEATTINLAVTILLITILFLV